MQQMYQKHEIKRTKYNILKKKIPDSTTLIHINQYIINKQNLENKMKMLMKK